ncbi:unnamed protein product [Musa textilis]
MRITVAKLIETSWFNKYTVQKPVPAQSTTENGKQGQMEEVAEPEKLNAFHLISFSEGFDLSPLFGEGTREDGMRFTTRESASNIVSKLEGVAANTAGKHRVTKSSAAGVRLEGESRGRKGKLAIATQIFALAPSVLVVEVRRDNGDTLEYQKFCADELRPALKDIIWSSSNCQSYYLLPDQVGNNNWNRRRSAPQVNLGNALITAIRDCAVAAASAHRLRTLPSKASVGLFPSNGRRNPRAK